MTTRKVGMMAVALGMVAGFAEPMVLKVNQGNKHDIVFCNADEAFAADKLSANYWEEFAGKRGMKYREFDTPGTDAACVWGLLRGATAAANMYNAVTTVPLWQHRQCFNTLETCMYWAGVVDALFPVMFAMLGSSREINVFSIAVTAYRAHMVKKYTGSVFGLAAKPFGEDAH